MSLPFKMDEGRGLHQNLKVKWDRYVTCNQDSQHEKKVRYLEEFLHQLISMSRNPAIDPEDLFNFCNDVHSALNILAREFMTEVKEVATSRPQTRDSAQNSDGAPYSQPAPQPQNAVLEFLMHNRGWVLLNGMNVLASQALTCNNDFIRLLLALLEEALKVPCLSRQNQDVSHLVPRMDICFPSKLAGRRKSTADLPGTMASHLTYNAYRKKTALLRDSTSFQGGDLGRGARSKTTSGSQRRKSKIYGEDDQDSTESESEAHGRFKHKHKSSNIRKHKLTSNFLMAFRNSMPKYQWHGGNLIVRQRMSIDDGLSTVDWSSTTPFDLCLTLLSLLEKLCSSEAMNAAHRNSLSLFLAPQLTSLLVRIDQRYSGQPLSLESNWGPELLGALKRLILRIVLKVCLYSLTQHHKVVELSASGLMQSLLEEAKNSAQKIMHMVSEQEVRMEDDFTKDEEECEASDSVFEASSNEEQHDPDIAAFSKIVNEIDSTNIIYISEILQGVLLLLSYVMYSCHDNQTVLTQGLAMLNEFEDCGGYSLFSLVVKAMDQQLSGGEEDGKRVQRLKESIIALISGVSKLIIATKKAKLEYIHKFQCLKRTHNNCDYSHYMHHHHSMLGMTYTAFEEDKQGLCDSGHVASGGPMDSGPLRANRSKCCIATVVEEILELLSKVQCRVSIVRLLGMLEQAGICCCMPPHVILGKLLHRIEHRSPAISNYLLSVIAKLVLEQLRGGEKVETFSFDLCSECVSHKHKMNAASPDSPSPGDSRTSDSAIGSDGSQQDGDVTKSRWQVLSLYANLLTGIVNEVLSVQVAKHLLHLVKHGNHMIKQELYIYVYLPCFESSSPVTQDEYAGPAPKIPYRITSPTVLEYCFSALPILLTSTFAQYLFLSQGGLTQLLHLLKLDTTRPHVLQVFEVIILSGDEEQMKKRDRSNTDDSGLSGTSAHTNWSSCSLLKSSVLRSNRDHASTVSGVLDAFTDIVKELIPDELLSKSDSSESSSQNQYGPIPACERPFDRLISSYDIIDEPLESVALQSIESVLGTFQVGEPSSPEKTVAALESNGLDTTLSPPVQMPSRVLMPKDCISMLSDIQLAMASDVWRTCANLIVYSPGFLEHFAQSPVAIHIHKVLNESLLALAQIAKECEVLQISMESLQDTLRNPSEDDLSKRDRFHVTLNIVGSLMRIQLKLCMEVAAGRFEGETMTKIFANVKHQLSDSDILGSTLGRTVADTLLKLAQLEPLDSSQYEVCRLSRTSAKDDATDGISWNLEELQEATDDQSEQSDLWSTEGGYEADSEREREDSLSNNKPDREDLIFAQSQQTLVYPQVCQLMMEVLSTSDGVSKTKVLYFLLNQLISLVKGSDVCKASLNECGVASIILDGYRYILQDNDAETAGERNLLLELFAELVQNRIMANELRGFLTLFQAAKPPLNGLLSTALDIVTNATNQPSSSISFPITTESPRKLATPLAMKLDHPAPPETNPWSAAAVQLPIRSNISWPIPFTKGFGVAMWVRVEERRRIDGSGDKIKRSRSRSRQMSHSASSSSISSMNLPKNSSKSSSPNKSALRARQPDLHLLSLGTKDMAFEVWLESKTAKLVFKISHTDDQQNSVLAETICTGMLTTGHWEHLTITYQEKKDEPLILGTISVIVNGHRQKDLLVDYQYSTMPPKTTNQPVFCLLGHGIAPPTSQGYDAQPHGSWSLGHLHIFNDASCLQRDTAFHLFSMGPNLYTLSQCEGSKQTQLYSRQITKDILIAGIKHELLIGDKEVDERMLRDSLVLTYTSATPHSFSLYPASSTGGLSKVLTGKTTPPSLLHCPTSMPVIHQCTLTSHHHLGLHKAVYEVGGIGVYIYLFAQVVEMCDDSHLQAKALQLLVRLQDSSHEMASEFRAMSGPLMVAKVLATERCRVGQEILKVLFDACCSESVIFQCSLTRQYKVNDESTAILQDTNLLSQMLLNWRIWERAEKRAWQVLLEGLRALVRNDHPFHSFNLNQMQRVGLVQKLLMICRERHSEDLPALPADSYPFLIDIIRTMLGFPADPHLMAEINDFLLAVHPAVNTFVCHAPSSFYFILHKGKWYKSRSSTPSEVTSCTSSDDVGVFDFKLQKPPNSRKDLSRKIDPSLRSVSPIYQVANCQGGPVIRSQDSSPVFEGIEEPVISPKKAKDEEGRVGEDEADGGGDKPDGIKKSKSSSSTDTESSDEVSSHSDDSKSLSSSDEQEVRRDRSVHVESSGGDLSSSDRSLGSSVEKDHWYLGGGGSNEGLLSMIPEDEPLPSPAAVKSDDGEHVTFSATESIEEPEEAATEDLQDQSHPIFSDDGTQSLGVSSYDSLDSSRRDVTLNQLCSGLLDLLAECLVFLPESNLGKVLGIILKPETLIVLAHHASEEIRTSVVKLLDVYFHRASEAQLASFLKMQGFHQLANQLHQYTTTLELVEACLTITFGKPISLAEDLDLALIQDMPRFRQLSVVLFLSQLENSTHNVALCHNMICCLLHLFEGATQLVPVLLENGLLETITNTLATLCTSSLDELDFDSLRLLLDDVKHLLACIGNKIFSMSGDMYFQYIEEMLTILGALEEMFRRSYGTQSAACRLVQDTECHVVKEILEHFQSTSKAVDSAFTAGPRTPTLQKSISYSERQYEAYKWRQRIGSIGENITTSDLHRVTHRHLNGSMYDRKRPVIPGSPREKSMSVPKLLPTAEARRYSVNLDNLLRMKRADLSSRSGGKDGSAASEQELAKRFQRLCLLAVNLVVNSELCPLESSPSLTLCEDIATQLTKDLFYLLIDALGATMERKLSKRKQFESIVWSSRQTLQLQLARLLVHMMSPSQGLQLRIFTLQVAHVNKASAILKCVLQTSMQQYASKLELYLYDLLTNHKDEMADTDRYFGLLLVDALKECGFQSINLAEDDPQLTSQLNEDLMMSWAEEVKARSAWRKQRWEKGVRINRKMDTIAEDIAHSAMEVTQIISMNQNTQRLQFLDHIKQSMSSALDVRTTWQHLIEQLTHERAVWLDSESYPASWQLDPTEGPGRVRRRLQRCHLHIADKFFLPEERARHTSSHSRPLCFLFDTNARSPSASELKRRLQMNEKISRSSTCTHVTPAKETKGELLLGNNSMYFVGEEPLRNITDASLTQVSMGDTDVMTIWWVYDEVKELHLRWYQLRDNALEIFLTNGKTLLLSFESSEERHNVYSMIRMKELPNLVEVDGVLAVTQAWRLGQMTNFEYLTHLNKLAGRSFNDLMQYPVFPFVLSNYTSDQLDLNQCSSYRDLTRPVAVQSKEREERYKDNFVALKEEYDKNAYTGEEVSTLVIAPYHYGSHYSNSGTVLQYLVRLPPFTQMFLHYQDNHFDLPDRTFHSVQTSWHLSSFQSTTDVKELIPEFYFLPEFLTNFEGYDFGLRQSGEGVHDVVLPPWCRDDARLFVLIQKQALESAYVSQHLHSWVDLVFGYKQQGQHAVEAINVFHPATYFGLDTRTINDPTKRRAIETMIKTYGQTPKQLFTSPHEQRLDPDTLIIDSPSMGSVAILAQLTIRAPMLRSTTNTDKPRVREPLSHVKGMRWGDYLGSPTTSEPKVRYQQAFTTTPNQLIPLPTGNVCGVAKNQCLLVMYSKERGVSSMYAVDIKWSGFLTWGHPDGILRLKHKARTPPVNFLQSDINDEITSCSSVSDCRLLFTGMASGIIIAYPIKYNPNKHSSIEVTRSEVRLLGHTGPVTCLCVCRPYSVLVSASKDGTCIIWDLNRLCYVRSLRDETKRSGNINAVTVSDVSGEIASVSDLAAGVSELTLWSINAQLIGRVFCHSRMTCVAFSNAPEGISINAVAAGCNDGMVRMWSTLDLSPIRNISSEMHRPITSLTFSHDSHFLFTCDEEGLVIAWGKKDHNKRVPKFEAFLNFPRNPSNNNFEASGTSVRAGAAR